MATSVILIYREEASIDPRSPFDGIEVIALVEKTSDADTYEDIIDKEKENFPNARFAILDV